MAAEHTLASLLAAESLDDFEDRLDAAVEQPELGPLMGLMTVSLVPPSVALAGLEGMKGAICSFAFCAALSEGKPLQPWLGRAIAQRWVRAQRAYLRLSASMPGMDVPLDVVPAEERMDLGRLVRETAAAQARFREFARLAQKTPGGIYPPHAEPDDD